MKAPLKLAHHLSSLTRPLTLLGAVMVLLALLTGDLIGQEAPPDPQGDDQQKVQRATATREKRIMEMSATVEAIPAIEDPSLLAEAGRYHLAAGNADQARKLFEASVALEEMNLYDNFSGTPYGEAVVLEMMGKYEESRAIWREQIPNDVIAAYLFIRHFSLDPERDKLLEEIAAHTRKIVAEAVAGGKPAFYTTSKGDKRPLEMLSNEAALEAIQKGERLRYVYIEELDLTGKTFEGRVGCTRCVVGSIKGWSSEFKEQFDFMGVVLGDVHLGKKWKGEANKSAALPGATFQNFFLNKAIILGNLNMDSVKVQGRVANMPLIVVEGEVNMRNASFEGAAEFRYSWFKGEFDAKGAEFKGSTYFGHASFGGLNFSRVVVHQNPLYFNSATFNGPVRFEKCELHRGATLENARFHDEVSMRQSRIYDRLNFSRAIFDKGLTFSQIQLTDLDFLGSDLRGEANFSDSVFTGNVRFALDGLTRRLHLADVTPLHKLYKQYQGDDDADDDLTTKSQYGVTHVDDLTAKLRGNVSFANTIFQKFVNFEGVQFGRPGQEDVASFFNTQFYGEAHFERTLFYALADFRTIFGNELSFNDATFYRTWMLDDANIPGRLSMSGATLEQDATLSFFGARIASFGVSFRQLMRDNGKTHRLFYEQCVLRDGALELATSDPRLVDARWDSVNEVEITDTALIKDRAARLCMDRTIGEFVLMKDSFSKRGMGEENDWSYWHLRHYKNQATFAFPDSPLDTIGASLEWLIFEKGFGWGVRLSNLLGTGLVVVLIFVVLLRLLCAEMQVDWDNQTILFKDLPLYGMFMISFHSFLGRARDWKSKVSPGAFKILYTTEMIIGIILITFFIGAYTRLVLR